MYSTLSSFPGTSALLHTEDQEFTDFRKLMPHINLVILPEEFKGNILPFLSKTDSHTKGKKRSLSVQFSFTTKGVLLTLNWKKRRKKNLLTYLIPSSVLQLHSKLNAIFKCLKKKQPCLYSLNFLFFKCIICCPTRMKMEVRQTPLQVSRSWYQGAFPDGYLSQDMRRMSTETRQLYFPCFSLLPRAFLFSGNYHINSEYLKSPFQFLICPHKNTNPQDLPLSV